MQYPPEVPQGPAPSSTDPQAAPKSKNLILIIVAAGACGCLLLCIIIASAIMLPVFVQARAKARATTCMSHEKQIGLGLLMYLQDWDEKFTPATKWMTNINPYIKDDSVYHCPAVSQFVAGQTGPPYGYAFNSDLSKVYLGDITVPEKTVMLYDFNTLGANASDPLKSYAVPGRHTDYDIFGFSDGHCRALPPDQLSSWISGHSSDSSNTGSGSQP